VKPVVLFCLVAAIGVLCYVAYAIRIGRVRFQLHVSDRRREPMFFWWEIGVYLLAAAGFLSVVVKETHFSN